MRIHRRSLTCALLLLGIGVGGIADRMVPGQLWLRAVIALAVILWLIGLLLDMTGVQVN